MRSVTISLDVFAHEILTANQRLHWAEKARRTRVIRQRARYAKRGPEHYVPMGRARCVAYVTYRDRRRRDSANVAPTLKACIDGVVDSGLLPDDDNDHLIGPDIRVTEPNPGQRGYLHIRLVFEALP